MTDIASKISAQRRLDHRAVERIIRAIITEDTDRGGLGVLDFSELEFALPFGIVSVITVLDSEAHSFDHLRLVCPESRDCLSYLGVSGFFEHLPDSVELIADQGFADKSGSWKPNTLLPLTRLDSSEDVDDVAQKVRERVSTMIEEGGKKEAGIKRRLPSTSKELCQNIFDHAQVNRGWVAAQRYSKVQTPYIELAIGDAGRGVRASLSERYPDLREKEHAEVLHRAIEQGLSRRTNRGRGMGFYVLKKAAKKLDGRFLLRSGDGALRMRRYSSEVVPSSRECAVPGTLLMVRFSYT
jgi:hypothetical protein